MKPLRILLADDHHLFRSGVRMVCESIGGFTVVGEASNGVEAVSMTCDLQPDVVLMDIQMPELDGVCATEAITEAAVPTFVIILTMYRQDSHVFEAVKAGARGYLLKDCTGEQLIEAVRIVANGGIVMPQEMTAMLLDEFRGISCNDTDQMQVDGLTRAEMNVLMRLVEGEENQQIADSLGIAIKTVANRLNVIYGKLRVKNRTQAALTALRKGLVTR